jgi:flagellar hook-basal body complex protein FliE
MSIDPIRLAQITGSTPGVGRTSSLSSSAESFENMLLNSISQIAETQATVRDDVIKLATGNTDALHSITINAAKADLAIQTMVTVRNKALDAYNEIMRITL